MTDDGRRRTEWRTAWRTELILHHPPPATQGCHLSPEAPRCFPIDSVIGASNVRPPADATPSRPSPRPKPIIQSPVSLCCLILSGNRQPLLPTMGRAGSPSPPLSRTKVAAPFVDGRLGEPSLPEADTSDVSRVGLRPQSHPSLRFPFSNLSIKRHVNKFL